MVRKEENAAHQLFLLVPQCFNPFQKSPGFYMSAVQGFSKHFRQRRQCSLRAMSPFPTVFSTCLKNFPPYSSNLKLSSANSFSFEESKICRLGKELKKLFLQWHQKPSLCGKGLMTLNKKAF